MKIETKIGLRDYMNLNVQLITSKISFYFIPLAIIILLTNNIEGILQKDILSILYVLVILVFSIWFPINIYKKLKREFYTHKNLQESIIFDFYKEKIEIIGETFQSEISWSNVHKVKELKKWFLIYQSNNLANLIQKKNFTQEQKKELRNLIIQNNINSKLRKD